MMHHHDPVREIYDLAREEHNIGIPWYEFSREVAEKHEAMGGLAGIEVAAKLIVAAHVSDDEEEDAR